MTKADENEESRTKADNEESRTKGEKGESSALNESQFSEDPDIGEYGIDLKKVREV